MALLHYAMVQITSLHIFIWSALCNCSGASRTTIETQLVGQASLIDDETSRSGPSKGGGRGNDDVFGTFSRASQRRDSNDDFNFNRGSGRRNSNDDFNFNRGSGRRNNNKYFNSNRGGGDRNSRDDSPFDSFKRGGGGRQNLNFDFGNDFNARAGRRGSARRFAKKFNAPRPSRIKRSFSPKSFGLARTTPDHRLQRLTKYVNTKEETTIKDAMAKNKFPQIHAKVFKLTIRAGGGEPRIASPFEHVCGGAATKINHDVGNDGPTQYISFSNAGGFPEMADDCNSPFDKGQRRITVSAETVRNDGGLAFDLSTFKSALYWCYNGGCVKTQKGEKLCFEGAKDIKPWPYACARRAYAIDQDNEDNLPPPDSWWTFKNRKQVADSCATWARRAREVLILPNPDRIFEGYVFNSITVQTDREPSRLQCEHNLTDHCTSWGETFGVGTVQACNEGLPNDNYQKLLKAESKSNGGKRKGLFGFR